MRGEESDGVVAPEVPQPPLDQKALVHEMVNRHQLDCRDAEALQILDRRRVCQARIGAAHLRGQIVPPRGEALDVQLVDHALVQWMPAEVNRTAATSPSASTTTERGTNGALSSVFASLVADPSGAMTWPKIAGS